MVMTGYHITIGYLSAADKDEAWRVLKDVVGALCADPAQIAAEAACFGLDPKTASEYAESYRSFSPDTGRTEDLTLVVKEKDPSDEESESQIMQLASGGGYERGVKEAMRRAFCRLAMREMHKREYEININVA